MSTAILQRETFLPDGHTDELAHVASFVDEHVDSPGAGDASYVLVDTQTEDQVAVPAELLPVLRQVVQALSQGLAVTITPQTLKLTSQQAADLLGISRPTLIRLLDEDQIRYERLGTHRRLQLRDVLAYREQRRAAQYAALEATAVPLDDEESVETALADLRQARKAVAAARRGIRPA